MGIVSQRVSPSLKMDQDARSDKRTKSSSTAAATTSGLAEVGASALPFWDAKAATPSGEARMRATRSSFFPLTVRPALL